MWSSFCTNRSTRAKKLETTSDPIGVRRAVATDCAIEIQSNTHDVYDA